MAPDDEEALNGRLCDAFAENVTSRSETARIRREAATKVHSHLDFDGSGEDIPTQVVSPRKEITGIRRRYLEALKANIEARERDQRASIRPQHPQSSQSQPPLSRADAVLSHLEFSRLEKHHQELDIRRRYVNSLSQDASTLCNLNIPQTEQRYGMIGAEELDDKIATSVVEVEGLTSKLHKAVLQANHRLERQKTLLAGTKQAQALLSLGGNEADGRGRAIAATRDALIAWLDEKLSDSGVDHADDYNDLQGEPNGDFSRTASAPREHYQRYLDARKVVMEAANEALRPLPVPPQDGSIEDEELIPKEPPPNQDDLFLVHAIRQRLAPLVQQHAGNMTLKTYSSAQTAKERQDTVGALERLADESHLLSTYPAGNIDVKDGLARNIAAWISAANASSAFARKVIEKYDREGLQALRNGEEELIELKLYQDTHETLSSNGKGINWKGIHGKLESSKVP